MIGILDDLAAEILNKPYRLDFCDLTVIMSDFAEAPITISDQMIIRKPGITIHCQECEYHRRNHYQYRHESDHFPTINTEPHISIEKVFSIILPQQEAIK